ncbi:MAG: hypothetical protein Q8L86_10005 [Vicinamibacterales bacterium]|nr:hypothetical protein [Vicinamibacterales bacterium]
MTLQAPLPVRPQGADESLEDYRAELQRQIDEHCALLGRMEAAAALPIGPARDAAIAEITAAMEAHSGPRLFPAPLP